jgi:hypothetical protein
VVKEEGGEGGGKKGRWYKKIDTLYVDVMKDNKVTFIEANPERDTGSCHLCLYLSQFFSNVFCIPHPYCPIT